MATKPEQEVFDEGEESDEYELGEDDAYELEEDEDEEGDDVEPKNMTALLLGTQTGVDDDDDDDDDEEYHESGGPIVAGSKRGVDELGQGDADEEEEEVDLETEGFTAKKARV